jgi:competence ComEA-like helix-hairpin-helix protein
MKDRTISRYVSIGILAGILLSGIFLLCWNSIQTHNSLSKTSTLPIIEVPIINGENLRVQSSVDEGKININQATVAELVSLPGIGETKAASIIEFREKYGAFENISELSYVSGIGNELLESIQELITTGND